MITKEKIAHRVISAQQGGEINSYRKLDPREVYEAIETNRNAIMQNILSAGGLIEGEFITQYKNVPILDDPATDQKYSILPTKLISFAQAEGLRQVSPMKKQQDSFIPLPSGNINTYGGLEAGKLSGKTGYYLERVKIGTDQSIRIYYTNCPHQYKDVLIKMVASIYDFAADEALPIPAIYEDELVQMVIKSLAMQMGVPLDIKNDQEPPSA